MHSAAYIQTLQHDAYFKNYVFPFTLSMVLELKGGAETVVHSPELY
jgi:hypothetical protein